MLASLYEQDAIIRVIFLIRPGDLKAFEAVSDRQIINFPRRFGPNVD